MSHKMNGSRSYPPSGPDAILFHLGRHEAQIDLLHTRVSLIERSRRGPFPWKELIPVCWGLLLFLLAAIGKMTLAEALTLIGRG